MTGAKILVVEDESITAMEIMQLLRTSGYQPYNVRSGDEAVQKSVELKPDLVLMDIGIKGENNGIKTAQIIKEFVDVPVIYLTANSDTEMLESIKLTKPSACVFKPFLGKEIIDKIKISLHREDNY
jgi:two-component system, response regulator PdtaR